MDIIRNPVLPGFHPDPSICRVGDDFYIANSSFEWFPGVTIHHSRDLAHWQLVARPLDRTSQLDMVGNPCSGGIWAPCLTWADGLFWLIYTDVKSLHGAYKDTPNYLVTAPDIAGPWSEPIFLNASGFDPSLFHDDDGRKWLVNMIWDHRPGHNRFAGTALQEYSHDRQRLVGPIRNICPGSEIGCTEGPHLYKRDGWYYLMLAEGGTGWNHAVSLARSRSINGPYEFQPDNPVLTSEPYPEATLQKAGHASLVNTPSGEWYLAHLASRPVNPEAPRSEQRCMLGRETALQKVHWDEDGWLRSDVGGSEPQDQMPAPNLPEAIVPDPPERHDFDNAKLDLQFQSLRTPVDESWCSLTDRPGFVRLIGRESLGSRHHQSLIARRVQHFRCEAATALEFEPTTSQQMAGLVAFYNVENWYYLHISHEDQLGRVLRLASCDNGTYCEPAEPLSIGNRKRMMMRLTIRNGLLQFYANMACGCVEGRECDWQPLGPELDATTLSDDYVQGWGFTGAFVGIACQDLSGQHRAADFDWFEYRPLKV